MTLETSVINWLIVSLGYAGASTRSSPAGARELARRAPARWHGLEASHATTKPAATAQPTTTKAAEPATAKAPATQPAAPTDERDRDDGQVGHRVHADLRRLVL